MSHKLQLAFQIVLVLALQGCAATGGMMSELEGRFVTAPSDLSASPATTGLLIVDASLKHQGSLSFGMEETAGLFSATLVKVGEEERPIHGGATEQVVVFQGLVPGTYRLVSLRGWTGQRGFTYGIDPSVVPPISIASGKATYIGHLIVKGTSRFGQLGLTNEYQWDRDPNRQVLALRRVRESYPKSPWAPLLNQQIQSIGQTPR